MIRFLQNNEIDREKWDNCIVNSRQSLIYGLSWYLDIVSPGWCGLEDENYSMVMPLPVKTKYGISYIIQPLYAQQLGVFSGKEISDEETTGFLNSIPRKYRFIAINLNYGNRLFPGIAPQRMNNNFELELNAEYSELASTYAANTRRNIQKSVGISVNLNGNADELVKLKSLHTPANRKRIPSKLLRNYLDSFIQRGAGFTCTAEFGGETCAAVFFLKDEKRIYYLIPVSNSLGKEKKAMFSIIDSVIQKYAGTPLTLDFEGSNLPGPARFFEGFSAKNNPYPAVTINRLPFPLNLFRKY